MTMARSAESAPETLQPQTTQTEVPYRDGWLNDLAPATGRIMVVDDVPLNVSVVCAHLAEEGYQQFIKVTDATQALSTLYREDPDVLLLDLMMPRVSGLDILQTVRADPHFAHLPVLILTASDGHEIKRQALQAGATDFLSKPLDVDDLIPRVRNALAMKRHFDTLERRVQERTLALEQSREEVVLCLARAAEHRDDETGNHVIRVGHYAGIIAREIGLEDAHVRMLELAAILHDVGKIGISDSILLKPDRFVPEEFELMKQHCGIGHSICGSASQANWQSDTQLPSILAQTSFASTLFGHVSSPLLKMAGSIALTHHEKWDGSGYPRGLAGDDIPLEGRITAVADVFDALSSQRPYKPAYPLEQCFEILNNDSGTHFDPDLVNAFLGCREKIVSVYEAYSPTPRDCSTH